MTLEQLRIFVVVAEREHVTNAAADLRLTQSAVSAAIAALEARYDTKLFDRVGRRIALSEAGQIFLDEARAVLARAAAAESVLVDIAGLKRGRLALAASQTVGSYWLPPLVHRFSTEYPGVAMTMRIANTAEVAAIVHDGAADIGVVEGEVDDPTLSAVAVAEDEMTLVVGPRHPWADGRAVEPGDIGSTRWVLRERGSGTRAVLEAVAAQAGLGVDDLDVTIELESNEAVRSAVEAGAGAAVMSRIVAAPSLASGALVQVAMPLPKRRFTALRHKSRHTTKAATAFLAMIGADVGSRR
ncbi:LysR family transcriptional regulator [Chelatococcus sambhunathii]|uniref:LysR family transcriptional regulator n=1 Tax=Chelatococcus sambhunathii TaxID=363953 RepID=A0ABU1DBG8_9HYPH|nr:LysR substrate-binding domain-containing protein [Chelatococcus sambhunathii]MDR4305410.1 LysR family transcriptional regulator [Chelatococcus sambhunathii]